MRRIKKIIIAIIAIASLFAVAATYKLYKSLKKACSRKDSVRYEQLRQEYYDKLIKKHTVQKIKFNTKDNIKLSGLLIKRPQAKRIFLLCHGYRQAKEFLAPLVDLFDTDTLLLFDFRAHGASEGERITYGDTESHDIHAALEFVYQEEKRAEESRGVKHRDDNRSDDNPDNLRKLPVYGLGLSMGAIALIKAAYEGHKFNGLILDSGYAVLAEQAERMFNKVTKLPQATVSVARCIFDYIMAGNIGALNACVLLQAIKTPVLIIHSETDQITPVCNAFELYKRAAGPKELWIVKEATHADIYLAYPEEYKRRVLSFCEVQEQLIQY